MKWIGQHVWSFISRFRSDVYLEDISTGTIASGAHLGLDSNNKIVKAVDGGGDLTGIIAGTGLSGTYLSGPIPTLNVDASQTQITSVGTIAEGTWQGVRIASDHLDTDTAHLSGSQTFTGAKTFDEDIVGQTTKERWVKSIAYQVAAGTTEYFIPMSSDAEDINNTRDELAMLMPVGGKLLKAHIKSNTNLSASSNQITVKMVNWDVDEAHTGSNDSIMCAVTQTGPTVTAVGVFDFTGTLDSGIGAESAAFTAGEILAIGIKHSQNISATAKYWVTLVFEMDWDSY